MPPMPLRAPMLLLLAFAGALLPAQGFRERPRRPGGLLARPGALAQAAPMLLQVRTQRIQQALGLPESQARALAERWARYDQEHLQKGAELGVLRARFNQILLSPGSEEDKNARLRPLVGQFMELRRQQMDLKTRFEDDVRANLTPAQQVRLIILVDELQQRLRDAVREARQGG